jgi:hypothetical protein
MSTIHSSLTLGVLSFIALACSEPNPNSCANNPEVCRPGTTCQHFKDSNGAPYSKCVADAEQGSNGSPDGGGAGRLDAGMTVVSDGGGRDTEGASVDSADKDAPPSADTAGTADTRLAADSCPATCTSGEQRCGAGGVQTCVASATGCPDWGAAVACVAPTMCKQAGSAAGCVCDGAGCVLGTQKCGPSVGLQTCVMSGSCTAWGAEAQCQGGATCHQTGPSTAACCSNACVLGTQQCRSNAVDTCVMKGGCTSWEAGSACPSPTTCQLSGTNATCTCPAGGCTVGNKQCGSGGGLQTCVTSGACTAWSGESSCGQYGCSGTACKTSCTSSNDCSAGSVCRPPQCAKPSCGDSVVDAGEECDKGAQNSAVAYGQGLCTDKCKWAPYCGDNIKNGPEKCDGGGSGSTALGACNPECTGFYEKRFIYRTNQTYATNMGGISGADGICVAEFGAQFKALLVGGSRRATVTPLVGDGQQDWVIHKYTHYYNASDQLIWRTDGIALLGVREGQRMNLYASVYDAGAGIYAWGGYSSDWATLADKTCSGWTLGTMAGDPFSAAFSLDDLTYGNLEPCGRSQYVLCTQQ